MVTLQDITKDNLHAVLALEVAAEQKINYPRSNAYSIAEGSFPLDDDAVWMVAICNNERPVGFMMTSGAPERGEYFIWRLMIDAEYQGRGYAEQALQLLIERIHRIGNPRLLVLSHLRTNTAAGAFFAKLGFEYTGDELATDDLEMRYHFDAHKV